MGTTPVTTTTPLLMGTSSSTLPPPSSTSTPSSSRVIPPLFSEEQMSQDKTPRQASATFQPEVTTSAGVNPTSTSSDNLIEPYQMDKMIDNFAYAPFTLGPINPINMEEGGVALRQAGLRQRVDVGRVDANIHPEMSLLEHILLKMDFNYLDTVPPSQKLQFRMPDPLR